MPNSKRRTRQPDRGPDRDPVHEFDHEDGQDADSIDAPLDEKEQRRARRLEAREIESTRLGTAVGVTALLAAAAAWFLTVLSLARTMRKLGVFAAVDSEFKLLSITYVAIVTLIIGGIGLLVRKTWGWWAALAGAVIGIGDLARLYSGLLRSINPNHPRAGEVAGMIVKEAAVPAMLYIGLIVLLCLPKLRQTYRISAEPRARRRSRPRQT